jgi:PST family polysaccharide transporter
MKDLKERTIRGGFAKICSQAANFLVRLGSLMMLARLLDPRDFGLVGMVTAVTGVLNLFKDFGLSTATVQRTTITEEQISTLFWINLSVGAMLGLLTVAIAPALAAFYREPRLVWVTIVLALGFVFNSVTVQHSALLQRQMRFTALSVIEIISLLVSTAVGISMAIRGYRYWSLVAVTVVSPLVYAICVWLTTMWIPGLPRKHVGLRSMMRFGGTLTLNGLVAYVAYNFEKILLGRFWGATAIGFYGRAYQLVNIPTDNLNTAVGGVAFAALSRLKDDPSRFKSYFLKGYSLVLALTVPITIVCTLFADDIIMVLLGPKWKDATSIFRLLAPTILIFALINPLGWLLYSLGLVERGLKIALVFSPLIIGGYVIGLPYGPKGVAIAYSAVMMLWVIPHIAWCVHGTVISFRDILLVVSQPLASSIVAAGLSVGVRFLYGSSLLPLPRLMLESGLLMVAYFGILLFVAGQKSFYLDLLRGLARSSSLKKEGLVSA